MPLLPLPPLAPIGGGDLVVSTSADVLAVLPAYVSKPTTALVRDAIAAGIREMLLEAQRRDEYAAAQSDILRATGIYLAGLGADRKIFKRANETDAAYRARILQLQDCVTPNAILAAINAILINYTASKAVYYEQLDCAFMSDGSAVWACFMANKTTDATQNLTPQYFDRLYPDDAVANNGVSIPGRGPGGACMMGDEFGRFFMIRVPDLAQVDVSVAAMATDGNTFLYLDGCFMGDGTSSNNTSFMQSSSDTEADIYNAIVTTVEAIKGHSVRWQLFADPKIPS